MQITQTNHEIIRSNTGTVTPTLQPVLVQHTDRRRIFYGYKLHNFRDSFFTNTRIKEEGNDQINMIDVMDGNNSLFYLSLLHWTNDWT